MEEQENHLRKKITVGYMYVMSCSYGRGDKMHMRSIGPYSLITQLQPLGGKAQFGGQRFGNGGMGIRVMVLLMLYQEMLTIKSDDVIGRGFYPMKQL